MSDIAVTALDPSLQALHVALTAGDRRALGRAISLVEAGDEAGDALCGTLALAHPALIVGFTGAPGAGKSTLINAYVRWLRAAGKRVAVLAVDPSSPFTRGAILGDRIRMIEHLADPGVFVRSLATRGHLGGLTATVDKVLAVVEAAGWDLIVLETVGTGQSETDLRTIADVNVLVVAPGQGDDVQAMKAGVLETAQLIAINKGDLPGADASRRHLSEMIRLTGRERTAIVQTAATVGDGLPEFAAAVAASRPAEAQRSTARIRRRIMLELERRLRLRLASADAMPELDQLVYATRQGEFTVSRAAALIEHRLLQANRT